MSCGDEVDVRGEMDEDRLRSIMVDAWLFRNLSVSEKHALEYRPVNDGEAPTIVEVEGDGDETRMPSVEVHVGCGDVCGVFAVIPWDGDMGCAPMANAQAIARAGRNMVDLVREVVKLRAMLARERVLCAAVWVDDGHKHVHQPTETGVVFPGWRHAQCIETAMLAYPDEDRITSDKQGFLTSHGRFVGRAEAFRIASTAGQLEGRHVHNHGRLCSEDLY